jgi:hypothetical protein
MLCLLGLSNLTELNSTLNFGGALFVYITVTGFGLALNRPLQTVIYLAIFGVTRLALTIRTQDSGLRTQDSGLRFYQFSV